jgi:hypothetical protein
LKHKYCKHQAIPEHAITEPAHQPEAVTYHTILAGVIKRYAHIAIKLMHAVQISFDF